MCAGELRGWGGFIMLSAVEVSARKFVIVYVPLLEILHYVQDDKVVYTNSLRLIVTYHPHHPFNITGIKNNTHDTVGVSERGCVLCGCGYTFIYPQ